MTTMKDDTAGAAWLDGRRVQSSLAFARGLHYGDGAFRTILKYSNNILYINQHIDKLLHDCAALDLKPSAEDARARLEAAGQGHANAVLKLLVMRRTTGRGYASRNQDVQVLTQRWTVPRYPASYWQRGVAAFSSEIHLAAQPRLAGIKHLNRLEQVLASRDWPQDVQEGILSNMESQPICGTRSNLFWVCNGRLHTPELSRCGVAGVMRDKVLQAASAMGVECRVECRPFAELLNAEEAFVSNSLIGIWPVRRLDAQRWRAPGPLTFALMRTLTHPILT